MPATSTQPAALVREEFFCKRMQEPPRQLMVTLAPAVLIGALLSCAFTLPLSTPFAATGKDVLLLAILGIFQLAIPCVMMVRASAHLSAPELALLGLLEVLMGPLWSWLGAGEVPPGTTLLGGAIVLAALVANEIVPKRRIA